MHHGPILVVEDDDGVRDAVGGALEDEGYLVEYAHDGADALEKLRVCEPCMVLTDLMMPRVSGWELLAAIRNDERLVSTRVAVLTAVPNPPKDVTVLRKPVTLQALLSTVRTMC